MTIEDIIAQRKKVMQRAGVCCIFLGGATLSSRGGQGQSLWMRQGSEHSRRSFSATLVHYIPRTRLGRQSLREAGLANTTTKAVATNNRIVPCRAKCNSKRHAVPYRPISIHSFAQRTWVSIFLGKKATKPPAFAHLHGISPSNMLFRCHLFDPPFNQSRVALDELCTLSPDCLHLFNPMLSGVLQHPPYNIKLCLILLL